MSLSGAVLDAGVAVVTGLALAPGMPARKRKVLRLLDGETPPLVLLAVGAAEAPRRAWKGKWVVPYPLSVAAVVAAGGRQGDNETLRGYADRISTALLDWYAGLRVNGLSAVNDVRPRALSVFDPPALDGAKLDWAVTSVTVEVLETRLS